MKPLTALFRRQLKSYGYPDIARFRYVVTNTADIYGVPQTVTDNRLYEGIADIPCRLDTHRAVVNDKLKDMVVTVDPYILEVPMDFIFDESDIVIIKGKQFKAKRVFNLQEWAVTQEILLMGVFDD